MPVIEYLTKLWEEKLGWVIESYWEKKKKKTNKKNKYVNTSACSQHTRRKGCHPEGPG